MNSHSCIYCAKEQAADALLSWPPVHVVWRYANFTIWIWRDHATYWERRLTDEELVVVMDDPKMSVIALEKYSIANTAPFQAGRSN